MSDADGRIIQLLTEMRDDQRKESALRRRVMKESLALARRAARLQRIALTVLAVFATAGVLGGFLLAASGAGRGR